MTEKEMAGCLTGMKLALPQWAPKEISRQLVAIWLDGLQKFSDREIADAIKYASYNLTQWPTVGDIKRLCLGSCQTSEQAGIEVAVRIEGAISNFGGWNNDLAMEAIGEIGQQVVRMCGGWREVCNVENHELMSSRKMWRDMATEIHRKAYSQGSFHPPALPRSNALDKALRIAQGIDTQGM
jgi:hypothetical protein